MTDTIVILDMDGTLIPVDAPDEPCAGTSPFSSDAQKSEFRSSVASVFAEARALGETHTVSAATKPWMTTIAGCYAPMHNPKSARPSSETGEPKDWKIEAFTQLLRDRTRRIVVIGDTRESEIVAGETVARDRGIQVVSLHVRAPKGVKESLRTHEEIRRFLRTQSRWSSMSPATGST